MPPPERLERRPTLEPQVMPRATGLLSIGEFLPRTETEIRSRRIWKNLSELYPDKTLAERAAIHREIFEIIARRRKEYRDAEFPEQPVEFTQKDAYVITYPDGAYRKGNNAFGYREPTLDTFERLYSGEDVTDPDFVPLDSVFTGVQLLPHQEASDLDRGFSQKDPEKVEPRFGSWENVKRLARKGVRVTVDQLVNHHSKFGKWFQKGEIEGDPEYQDLFESYPEDDPPHKDYEKNFFPREHEVWRKIKTWRG